MYILHLYYMCNILVSHLTLIFMRQKSTCMPGSYNSDRRFPLPPCSQLHEHTHFILIFPLAHKFPHQCSVHWMHCKGKRPGCFSCLPHLLVFVKTQGLLDDRVGCFFLNFLERERIVSWAAFTLYPLFQCSSFQNRRAAFYVVCYLAFWQWQTCRTSVYGLLRHK